MWKIKRKQHPIPLHKIDTLLGKSTLIEGDLHFSGGLQLDGMIRGNVTATEDNSLLVIGENGRIEGEVRAPHVLVRGQVQGPIYTSQNLDLASSAVVSGDVFYHQIEVHMGAHLNGKMVCMTEKPLQGELIHEKSIKENILIKQELPATADESY